RARLYLANSRKNTLPREVHAVDENAASRGIDPERAARQIRHFAAVVPALDAAAIAQRNGAVGSDRDRLRLTLGVGAVKRSDRPRGHRASMSVRGRAVG